MSTYGSASVGAVLIDGFSLMGYFTSVGTMKKTAVTEDVTVLGAAWRNHDDSTLREFEFGPIEGFYDSVQTVTMDDNTTLGVARVVCVLPDGNTAGKNFMGCVPKQTAYDRMITIGELHKIAVDFAGSGEMDDGIILHALGVEADDGDTEGALSQDQAASSVLGAAAYLQLAALDLDGGTNLAVHIRHSTDDVTYATLASFTVRTAIGAERIAIAAGVTINRYIATSWVYTGSEGAAATATFMVGFARYLANNT